MKMKKVLAAAAASVLAVSAMSVVASANSITSSDPSVKDIDGNGNWGVEVRGGDADDAWDDVDITKIVSVEYTITFDDSNGEAWLGGQVFVNSEELGWKDAEFDNGSKDIIVTSGTPFVWQLPGALTDDEAAWLSFGIKGNGGSPVDFNIEKIRLLDASGNEVKPGDAAPTETPDSTPDSTPDTTTTPDDTSKPNTNTGVEGIAAVVGVAVVAAGAMVVAKKRK